MTEYWIGIASAFWFGILTSISPCPLATNIAAVSYIGNKAGNIRAVAFAGILYAVGRTVAYTLLGIIIVAGLVALPSLSFFLQKYVNIILGPLLIIVGMFLIELIQINLKGSKFTERLQNRVKDKGIIGSFLLGIIFALAFCPVSAALFFGSLIPISIKINAFVLPSVLYGIGTGLPVIIIGLLFSLGNKSAGMIFNKITVFEKWTRLVTGVLIILIGVYLSLVNIFNLW
jgi:cytochrome c-type biogenesis protein